MLELGEIAERRHPIPEIVVAEVDELEVGEVSETKFAVAVPPENVPAEVVVAEIKMFKPGEAVEFGRNGPCQSVVA